LSLNDLLLRSIDASPDGILIVDQTNVVVYANTTARTLLSIRPETNLEQVLRVPCLEGGWRGDGTIQQDGRAVSISVAHDSETGHFMITFRPYLLPIQHFDFMFRHHPLPLWVYDQQTLQFLAVNEAAIRAYGYTQDEFLSMTILALQPFNDRSRTNELLANRQFPYRAERQHIYKNGSVCDVEIYAQQIDYHEHSAVLMHVLDITARKQTELALLKSQERLYATLRSIEYGVFSVSLPDYQAVYISPAMEKVLGYAAPRLYNDIDFMESVIHPEDRDTYLTFARNWASQATADQIDFRIIGASQEVRWIRQKIWITRNEEGKPIRAEGINSDITENKLAELRLHQSEQRLQAMITNVPATVFAFDRVGKVTFVAGRGTFDGRYPLPYEVGNSIFDLTASHPDWEVYIRMALDGMSTNHIYEYEGRSYEAWYAPSRDEQQNIIEVVGVSIDVTEREVIAHELDEYRQELETLVGERTRELSTINSSLEYEIEERIRVEAELRLSEARIRSLVQFAPDYILELDLSGHITEVNPAVLQATGYSLDKMVNHFLHTFVSQQTQEQFDRTFTTLMKMGMARGEIEFVRADGTVQYMDFSAKIVDDHFDLPAHIIMFMRDITERRNAERTLRESLERERELSQLRSRFVTVVSHGFRNPLATIQTTTDVLRDYLPRMSEDEIMRRLHKITHQVRHMTGMLDDVSSLGRFQLGRVSFNPTPLDIVQLCLAIISEMELAPTQYHFEHSFETLFAPIDQKLFHKIFGNILDNAIKYGSTETPCQIKLFTENDTIRLDITDYGIGIPADEIAHLSEVFHRGRNTAGFGGNGLGLAVAHEAIALHGGSIGVVSEVGQGSTFTIRLPMLIRARNLHHE
jgi:PAS domain S-box-containing protein